MDSIKLLHGDCLDILRRATPNSVDSIVTDPPYGLSFMGKKWDYDVPSKEIWQECLRVLKPGGYLLSFAGTRTQHRMAVNIEDAGFEIRDMIAWVYGSGFPKSLNIGKAVDKLQGNERKVVGHDQSGSVRNSMSGDFTGGVYDLTKGNSEWEGWGTALKPALEPITVARKPLSEKTVAENVLKWGTGGINIDGSRIETDEDLAKNYTSVRKGDDVMGERGYKLGFRQNKDSIAEAPTNINLGRFPANFIHDGSDEVVSLFPDTKSGGGNKGNVKDGTGMFGNGKAFETEYVEADSGSAARFFYCAKASKADRDEGLEGFEEIRTGGMQATADGSMLTGSGNERTTKRANHHPTVKPTKLMQYLVKLVTPKGGTVLDPFMGSGSTGKACKLEGFNFIGIEREEEYIEIAKARINNIQNETITQSA